MNRLSLFIVSTVVALFSFLPQTAVASESDEPGIDVKEIVLGHMSDAYSWHIVTWNGHHVSIPLPVIVKGEHSGWHVFMSSRLDHGHSHEGFFIDETQNGKIYERLDDGTIVRPLDFSITKDVLQIWIVVGLMLWLFIGAARWYRCHDVTHQAPGGMVGLIEMFVMMIYDDLIRPSVGERKARFFAPYLLCAFFFIFITNLLGLIPIFPGGANVTGNITITFFLAMFTMLAVNLFGNKEYWKEIFWPEVPTWLKAPIPIMPVIEFFGVFTKPFALMVRLFANIMAGHAIILSITCVIFITCQIGVAVGASISIVSFVMMIFMNALEFLVAFIQAYVFTMLSAVFIGLAQPEHHAHKA